MASGMDSNKPLEDLEHWEEFLKDRYPAPEEAELVPVGAPEMQPDGKWKATVDMINSDLPAPSSESH